MRTLLLALLLLLAACAAPAGPAPAAPAGGAPVRIGFGGLDFERAAYQPAIDAFNAANPDVRVEFVPLEALLTGGGDPADTLRRVAESADTFVSLLAGPAGAESGYLADLRPLLEADAAFAAADFQPGALPPGRLFVLPTTLSVQTLSYNRDLWEAAGLAAPAPGWGWGDLLAAAEQLARRAGDAVQVYGVDDGQDGRLVLQGLLSEAGVSLAPAADGSLDLDQPAVAAALAQVVDLIERGVIYRHPSSAAAIGPDEIGAEIRAGRVAMWLGGALLLGGPDAPDRTFAVADAALPPMPRDSLLSARGYAMSVGSAHPAAAWRWLSYLSAQTISFGGGIFIMGLGHDLPARRSLADAAGFWQGLPADRAAALQATLAGADRLPPPASELVRGNLDAALRAALAGAPAEQAVADAAANLARQLVERAAQPTPAPAAVQVQLPDPVVVPDGATRISFSNFGADPATLRRLAEQFNGLNSGVYVEIAPPAFGGEFSMAALTAGLDCFAWPGPPAAEDRPALRDLQPLLDADASAEGGAAMRADYPPALLTPFRADGRLYGLPYAVTLRALTYNRDAFAAAGLEPPRADWSLEEFLEAARRLTDKGGADPRYGYAIEGGAAADLLTFLAWQGAEPFGGAEHAPRFSDPQVVRAIRSYVELLRDFSPHTSLPGYRAGGFIAAAGGLGQAGRLGMWYSGGFAGVVVTIGDGPAAAPPDLAVAPPPLGRRGLSGADLTVSGLYIAAGSAHPEACWQWLSFLSRQAGGLGEQFPARASVATSAEFLGQARPGAAELYAAYAAALAQPSAAADRPAGADLFWLLQAVDRALQGGDLERELAEAQATTEQHLACVAAGTDPARCAKSVDPEYAGAPQ